MALPVVSGQKVIKALTKAGFTVEGKKGSHVKLRKKEDGKTLIVIVPDHKELARGTLKSILRQANLARDEFLTLL